MKIKLSAHIGLSVHSPWQRTVCSQILFFEKQFSRNGFKIGAVFL